MIKCKAPAVSLPQGFSLRSTMRMPAALSLPHHTDWAPELVELARDYVVWLPLRGLGPEDIEVTASPRELRVRLRRHSTPTAIVGGEYVLCCIETPTEIRADSVKAMMQRGILTINAPRREQPSTNFLKRPKTRC